MQSPYIQKVTAKILTLDKELSKQYSKALEDSLKLDTNSKKGEHINCKTATDLATRYGLGLDLLTHYGVTCEINGAVEFLNSVGNPITFGEFRGKYHKEKIKEVFGKPATTRMPNGKGAIIYTYAQVLHLVNQLTKVDLPVEIDSLLENE